MLTNSEIDKISEKLVEAVNNTDTFFQSFLTAYGFPKVSITRALNDMNASGIRKCSIKQRLLYLERLNTDDLEGEYLDLLESCNSKERFVFVTDFKRIIAKNTKYNRGIDIDFKDLPDKFEFFFDWCGREKVELEIENPADVKAASEMGHLFEIIHNFNKENKELTERSLNIFLTRLLFCCFADDTGIFGKDQFRESLRLNTADDGSDTKNYLEELFIVLNTSPEERGSVHPKYKEFPYVNGGLFREQIAIPNFDKTSRHKLLECCTVDWSGINPDIFGSMFQTVINIEQRRNLGQHYTSVTNIMKVLKPLFLDELNEELDRIYESPMGADRDKRLTKFRHRLGKITVFDPACGSGNFLIIAYKELCKIEMRAMKAYEQLVLPLLSIRLNSFYGIEIDDFPCEVARLALWLVQHQINREAKDEFGITRPTLPLTSSGKIVCGNALSLDWNDVCPIVDDKEVYICGNPPFAGHQTKTDSQRADTSRLFQGRINGTTDLDYVCCWFIKASEYIQDRNKSKFGFVSTNSIIQGKHVSSLWPYVLRNNKEIFYGYESFKWSNNAKNKAGVTVTIIGVRNKSNEPKYLYRDDQRIKAKNINSYLKDEDDRVKVLDTHNIPDGLPKCSFGTMFIDGGFLIFKTQAEKNNIIQEYPEASRFIRELIGSQEFIRGEKRYCLWIDNNKLEAAMAIPPIKERLEKCYEYRCNATPTGDAYKNRNRYWQAREFPNISKNAIIIARVSSEKRKYIPIGYLSPNVVISDSAFAIYDAPRWLFAILTSNMHMIWMRAVSGKLETRYRYSNTLVYNTFPFPKLTDTQKKNLGESAMQILIARENHYDMTMAQLYNADTMPEDLKVAHESNDLIIDTIFCRTGFSSDEDRLAELFRLYELKINLEENCYNERDCTYYL